MENKNLQEFLNNSEFVPEVYLGSKGLYIRFQLRTYQKALFSGLTLTPEKYEKCEEENSGKIQNYDQINLNTKFKFF